MSRHLHVLRRLQWPPKSLNGATALAALIRTKQVTPREVVQAQLDRIQAVNLQLNALAALLKTASPVCDMHPNT